MRKVVFLGCPAYGHTYPTLAVVKELTERGVKVIYYNSEQFREPLEKAGAEFRAYRSKIDLDRMTERTKGEKMSFLFRKILPIAVELVENHLEEIRAEEASCLVYDSMALWALKFALELGIPAVSSVTTFAMNERMNIEALKAATFREKLNFIELLLFLKFPVKEDKRLIARLSQGRCADQMEIIKQLSVGATERVVYTSRELQPGDDDFKDNFNFVGPSITDRQETCELPADDRPLIYISCGTVFSNMNFFQTAFEAFGDGKYHVLLSVSRHISIEEFTNIPPNFTVRNYFPQLEVLKRAALFVSHCGMNSAHESLYYGVPIVGLPQMAEQALVARAVERAGAGIYLRKVSAKKLRAAAEKILADDSYRENCLRLQKGFKAGGGAARAAELIMKAAGIKAHIITCLK